MNEYPLLCVSGVVLMVLLVGALSLGGVHGE